VASSCYLFGLNEKSPSFLAANVKYEASTSTGAKLAGAGTATGSTRAAQFSTKLS